MTVHHRESRGWYVHFVLEYPDGSKKRVRKKSPRDTKRAAESFERELRQQMLEDWRLEALGLKRDIPTLEAFEGEFFAILQNANIKQSTIESYRSIMGLHLRPFFGKQKLSEISPRDIEKYKQKKSYLSAKTVKNQLGVLSKLLRVAVRMEIVDRMPFIELPGSKNDRSDAQGFDFWDDDEEERVLAKVDTEPRIANWIRLALATGLRSGELTALQWGDIDLVKRQLTVRRQYYKGNYTTPKSNRLRSVPLSEAALDALERQKPVSYMRSFGDRDLVFVDDYGVFDYNRIADGYRRVIKAAGVKRIRIHDMRHTFATKCVRCGVPIEVLQKWLGHSDIRVTMRYAHLAPDHSHSFISLLDHDTHVTPRGVRALKPA